MPSFNINKQNDENYFIEGDLTFFTLNNNSIKSFDFLKSAPIISLDLSGVSLADSAGLALLVELIKNSKHYNTQLLFKNIPKQLVTLARLGGLDIEKDLN